MKRTEFYVTLTWDDWPEGGSFGTTVMALDYEEAEALAKDEMAASRAESYQITEEDALSSYGHLWHVVDCFKLDEFINMHIHRRAHV